MAEAISRLCFAPLTPDTSYDKPHADCAFADWTGPVEVESGPVLRAVPSRRCSDLRRGGRRSWRQSLQP